MIKNLLFSLWNTVKLNPKSSIGTLAIGALGLAIYIIRSKQDKNLYKVQKQNNLLSQSHRRNSQILQKYGINDYQNIAIPVRQENTTSSTNILSTNETIIEGQQCQYLYGWHIYSTSKIRENKRLIIYYYSQHTKISDNLAFIKNLVETTVSDVLIVGYRYHQDDKLSYLYQSQQSMKTDAEIIFNKGLQIALRQKKDIIVLGKDLGAMLGIYMCSMKKYQIFNTVRGLIIQNPFSSIPELKASKANSQILSKYLLSFYNLIIKERWQCKKQIKKIKVATMLLLRQEFNGEHCLILYSQFPGRKFIHKIQTKSIDNRNVQNLTNLFMDIDIFLNSIL